MTNACTKPTTVAGDYSRDETKVAAAIAAGNAGDLIRAGGTPIEVGKVLVGRCGQPPDRLPCALMFISGTEAWARFPDGGIALTGQFIGPEGQLATRIYRSRDMVGITAPEGVPTAFQRPPAAP